jgi:ABC-type amino acid transport substrate-binding protein
MTSLLSSPHATSRERAADPRSDLATRRPLVLVATFGGLVAAAGTLLVCLGAGVTGWFLTDGGAHGEPRDGLRTGALAWLMGHGSGVLVDGVAVSAVPLGITVMCAWTLWRVGQRVGVSVSGHGPDVEEIADGQRDWTVPVAVVLLSAGYVVVAVLTSTLAATPATDPSAPRVVTWALLLCLLAGAPGIAVGSGRAAIWTSYLPASVRASGGIVRRLLLLWLAVSALAFAVALLSDLSTAANVLSQLDADAGATLLILVVSLLLLPNALAFSGSYLLGPGFTVGTGTLVAPSVVVLGPLPSFPMLAALPEEGPTASWTAWLIVLPPLVAFLAVVLHQRRAPLFRYEEGAVRGVSGGVVAGLLFGLVASLAGGAVGPGRMQDVAPYAFDTMLHAVTSFGIGGLLGGLAMTWWQRRSMPVEIELDLQ